MSRRAETLGGDFVLKEVCHKTIGEIEAEISQAMIRFEKEIMGRGPLETRTFLVEDMVLIRFKGVLTPGEIRLAEAGDSQRGRDLVKQARQELLNHSRPRLEAMIRDVLGVEVRSLHTDISTKTDERLIVLSLDRKPDLGPAERSPRSPSGETRNGRRSPVK